MNKKGILLFIIIAVLSGCGKHAETEVRAKFDIPVYKDLSVENIEAAVFRKIPKGTKEKNIYEILKKINIGEDKFSSFYEANDKGEVVVRFEYDPREWGLVKKHYGIVLKLDKNSTLQSVEVLEWLTGI